jgi:hypothetical protein
VTIVTVVPLVPEVVQTGTVSDVNATASPPLAVAETVKVFITPIVRFTIEVKVMVWAVRML